MADEETDRQEVLDPDRLTAAVVRLAHDKKAIDVVELDLTGMVDYTEGFVIATGRSDRQVKAIHDGIVEGLKKEFGILPRKVEGLPEARWVVIDLWDIVVHLFQAEARETYRLERLWGEAPTVEHPEPDGDDGAIGSAAGPA